MNVPTTPNATSANEAQFLAPETHQRAGGKKLKIGTFREAVDTLNWNRRDLAGATREEFIREDVQTRLERHIEIVEGMLPLVPPRFVADVRHAGEAIKSAREKIAYWESCRPTISEGNHDFDDEPFDPYHAWDCLGDGTEHMEPHEAARGLPQPEHLEVDDFATRLVCGELRLTSIGAENAYAVDAQGREFYAKDVAAGPLAVGAEAAGLEHS